MVFRSETMWDRALICTHLLLVFLLTTVTTVYIYLPFRHLSGRNGANETDVGKEEDYTVEWTDVGKEEDYTVEWTDSLGFKATFYSGLGLGSLAGGLLAYLTSPGLMTRVLSKLFMLASLLAACMIGESQVTHAAVWFLMAFMVLALYTCSYIHTVESVPGGWVIYVGLGMFGLIWSTARLYSILLARFVPAWPDRLLWNTFILFCVITLQDLVTPREEGDGTNKPPKETLGDLFSNPLGRRYFACLLVLWAIHGYVSYGISHHIYRESFKSHVYVCFTVAVSKAMGLFLCWWTGQKRAVISALLMLTAITCFTMAGVEDLDDNVRLVSVLSQVSSFLISGSWNILWLFSVEIVGCGSRCVVTGASSLAARVSSLLGVFVVDTRLFLNYPAAIIGALCVAGGLVLVFLLPEPDPTRLADRTRTRCRAAVSTVRIVRGRAPAAKTAATGYLVSSSSV